MITGIAHVCIVARDLAATERFYCRGLGLAKTFRFLKNDREIGYYLRVNETNFIEVFQDTEASTAAQPLIRHVCLQVASLDPVIARLRQHGYEVTEKKLGADQSWQAWTADPGGVKIELHEYTLNSSQTTGKDCTLN